MNRAIDPKEITRLAPCFTRRHFLGRSAVLAAALATANELKALSVRSGPYAGKLCFFSKALPTMDWKRLAEVAKQAGFSGLDLTVRRGGHVAPERVAEDLPKAVAVIRGEGLDVPMITTALASADDPTARPILATAGRLSIPYCKPGYYYYELNDVRRELARAGDQFHRLAAVAIECGVQLGYHNHDEYVGASVWDAATFIEPLDPKWVGYYFDPRHAVAEGGVGAWKIALNLVMPRLKMVAVKDFYWEKSSKGWQAINCPLGEGMVDWKYFCRAVAQAGFQGPISLHIEYEVPGLTSAAKEENTRVAAKRDLEFIRGQLIAAYGADSKKERTVS